MTRVDLASILASICVVLRRSCDAPSQAIDLTGEIDLRRCVTGGPSMSFRFLRQPNRGRCG